MVKGLKRPWVRILAKMQEKTVKDAEQNPEPYLKNEINPSHKVKIVD